MKQVVKFIYLLCLFSVASYGQNRISIQADSIPFTKFIEQVESKIPYHFYFKQNWVDTLWVNAAFSDMDIRDIISEVLKPTDIQFAIDGDNNVYLTKGTTILTQLPAGIVPGHSVSQTEPDFDASYFEQKTKKRKEEDSKVFILGTKTKDLAGKATITGVIKLGATGEPLPGASIFIQQPLTGSSSDYLGRFELTIPKGRHILLVQSIGMKAVRRNIILYGNGKIDIELEEEVIPLKDVTVNAEKELNISGTQMGREKMDIRVMRQMPLVLGETDVMKVVLALPGVQSVGEGTTGLNVRGGATNQNLILFNDATVYNPSHLFGFFSTFNPDVLKSFELFKSGFEANYGGRLSSVLNVTTREGNLKKFTATGGISPITGRLTLEGPIWKGKTSFLVAARSTYSDWILKRLDASELNNSQASFNDLNFHIGHKINENNQLQLSAYSSRDKFRIDTDQTQFHYGDQNGSIKWDHRFSPKLSGSLIATTSQYSFELANDENPVTAYSLAFKIRQFQMKADFNYILTEKHTLHAGVSSILYKLNPGTYLPEGDASVEVEDIIEAEKGLESAIYLGDNFEINDKLSLYAGIRYSHYSFLGPKDVYAYTPGEPIEKTTITDTVQYGNGPIKSYHGPEPRLTARYLLSRNASIKMSYTRTRQYIQMLSNTTAITPTDIWKLSDKYVKPQVSDQFSAGWFWNTKGSMFEISTEAYYKFLSQVTDYQNGAILFRNHHLETDVINAKGKAYGIELMVKKSTGRLNGWVSYVWSRSFFKSMSEFETETINNGSYYPSNFDKPHAVNLVCNYKFNRRINMSFSLTYSTGRPITLPVAKFELDGVTRLEYSQRNAYRVPDYFRSDFSINIEGNHKVKKFAHSSWTLAVYNLTGRRNAYSVFYESDGGTIKGYKLSIFGEAIPTITYNFKL